MEEENIEEVSKELDMNSQEEMQKACFISGNNTCQCWTFCTLCGEQINSIFS